MRRDGTHPDYLADHVAVADGVRHQGDDWPTL